MRVETVLTEEQLASRIWELAREIRCAYADSTPMLLSLLKGSIFFLADLARALGNGFPIEFMAVASYNGTRSTRAVEIRLDICTNIEGRDVLIVEDIVETGLTLEYLLGVLKARGAASVRVVTLLFKPGAFQGTERPDFIGFELPNDYVVGYGMDLNEEWRNMRFVGRLAQ